MIRHVSFYMWYSKVCVCVQFCACMHARARECKWMSVYLPIVCECFDVFSPGLWYFIFFYIYSRVNYYWNVNISNAMMKSNNCTKCNEEKRKEFWPDCLCKYPCPFGSWKINQNTITLSLFDSFSSFSIVVLAFLFVLVDKPSFKSINQSMKIWFKIERRK